MSAYSDVLAAASQESIDAMPPPEDIPVVVVGIDHSRDSSELTPGPICEHGACSEMDVDAAINFPRKRTHAQLETHMQ